MAEGINAVVTYRDLIAGFRSLELDPKRPVIAHASLSAFGEVRGGVETLLGAIMENVGGMIMPAFTSCPEIIPEVGPDHNGIDYGSGHSANMMAEFFDPQMPADKIIGVVSEALRKLPGTARSNHPLLSFTGVSAAEILAAQSYEEPLGPVRILSQLDGWVLLLGVDHTVNTSIHYAEMLSGRKQFIRWALTKDGVCQCPGYPGCSNGFNAVSPHIASVTRRVQIGAALVQAVPLNDMIATIKVLLETDPLALLCTRPDCSRCNTIRRYIMEKPSS